MFTIAETPWYVINVKPKLVKKVLDSLTRKQIENYFPLNSGSKSTDPKKKMQEPLFLSYVFVKLDKIQPEVVMKMQGVVNFVYWLNEPVKICSEDVNSMKQFLKKYDTVHLEKCAVNTAEHPKLTNGAAIRRDGKIVHVNGSVIKLEIPSLGYTLSAYSSNGSQETDAFKSIQANNPWYINDAGGKNIAAL